jgi:hypothetical protein
MENDLLFCSILKLMFTNGKIIVYKFMIQFYSYLFKSTLGQNFQMFDSMRAKKTSWDKTAIFLSVWRQKKKPTQRTKVG